jgi:hypothetical protein
MNANGDIIRLLAGIMGCQRSWAIQGLPKKERHCHPITIPEMTSVTRMRGHVAAPLIRRAVEDDWRHAPATFLLCR